MLTHIVCWKYKAETSAAARAEHIAGLRALQNLIPNILSFSVGADIQGVNLLDGTQFEYDADGPVVKDVLPGTATPIATGTC